jgi:putative transcriptional regulator
MGKRRGVVNNHIRTLRFQRNEMTQQALADQVGITRQTINAIEGNKYSPSLEVAFLIAKALDVRLEQVFEFVEN